MRKKKAIILIAIFLILLYIVYGPYSLGSFGIRPETHGCFGLTIPRSLIEGVLPEARVEFFNFAYYVNEESLKNWTTEYCLGRDIWYGE